MFDNLREDVRQVRDSRDHGWPALEALLFDNGFQAVVLYRVARFFRSQGVPILGPLFARLNHFLTGVDINPAADIGPGLRISHGTGIVVGGAARIGKRALIMHDVTLGAPRMARLEEMPVVGDDVFIGAGARLIGPVRVGNGCFIGVQAIVTEDVPDRHRVLADCGVKVSPLPEGAVETANPPTPDKAAEA